jgi:uncharacterized membrane protein
MVAPYVAKGGYLVRLMVNLSHLAALVILWDKKDALYTKIDHMILVNLLNVSG